ncbi:hypothetical protein KTT_19910 [Tengunoibacter tsumagoiensis]|uniref:HEAT repeat-containing PBS lyase n=1 Tax=Tengunoibacter tsumagoiensis TaxID=2014871 RepID=A0A401ZZ79_9CHLR|nr:hypothetical protein KTT_19910 [Tengunoibacter tsumagoiensis]
MRQARRENVQAALTLLLGPETEYALRVRATRRLIRYGPDILPIVLNAFTSYPEITTPAWPWWPPQYEHTSKLLLHLSQQAHLSLEDLLTSSSLTQPPGPVLWASIIEATSHVPHSNYEQLLCQGLAAPWQTVRYAAALALATRSSKVFLHADSLQTLRTHQTTEESYPVRLTCSYALLLNHEQSGLEILLTFLYEAVPIDIRKAALFILSTELPVQLVANKREQATTQLLHLLFDPDPELALQAAYALHLVATPALLPRLADLLVTPEEQGQAMVLVAFEELAKRQTFRQLIRHLALPARFLPFLKAQSPVVRRQACYTLAACGGEYVAAVLGTVVITREHPAYLEAIECLRFLHGVLRAPLRENVLRWLIGTIKLAQEEGRVTALDTLASLLWQARKRRQKQAWQDLSLGLTKTGVVFLLLHDASAWIRQRILEMLPLLYQPVSTLPGLEALIESILLYDADSGVRACAAYICRQLEARWALPALLLSLLDVDKNVARTALLALEQLASPEDTIVVAALQELALIQHDADQSVAALGLEAQALLNRWLPQSYSG